MVFSREHDGGVGSVWGNSKGFTLQVLSGRWFMVFSSFMIMSVSGASYMFGLYSREIKSVLGYDQSTLTLLSFFKDLGSNIGIISGLINEVTPPWVVLTIGGVLNFFGYFMIWLAVTNKIANPPVWNMCLYIFIGANSHCSTNTGALVTSVKNFPGSRGIVIGLLSGYLGFLMVMIIVQKCFTFTKSEYYVTSTVMLLLLILPLVVVIMEEERLWKRKQEHINSEDPPKPLNITTEMPNLQKSSQTPQAIETTQKQGACWRSMLKPPSRGDDHNIFQALFSLDMVVLFLSTICGLGGTLTVVNNLSQIGLSLGYPGHSITTFVSLMAIWIYMGHLYDKEARRQLAALGITRKQGEQLNCNGSETREFYKGDIYKKFREEARTAETQMAVTQNKIEPDANEG
ncbi:Nodulin-like [Sesbania bispinosa]|nr:Nodulin-like [Sesbania bispinosa]